jgi:hypothetical protein
MEDSIGMDLREIKCEVLGWIHLAEDSDHWRVLANILMKF